MLAVGLTIGAVSFGRLAAGFKHHPPMAWGQTATAQGQDRRLHSRSAWLTAVVKRRSPSPRTPPYEVHLVLNPCGAGLAAHDCRFRGD